MSEIDRERLRELEDNINLLEYAELSFDFRKGGDDSYFTHCPLHIDKTPSLKISKNRNVWHCFSCGKGGGLLSWLMTIEGLSFNDAVEKICKLTGQDAKNLKTSSALKFYKEIRRSEESALVSPNQIERKILPISEIEKFSADIPEEWIKEGISPETMKRYQVRIDYDSNRIVYPVWDNEDRLIGFKGRTRFPDYKEMKIQKYMNYTKIGTVDYFGGMKENRENIIDKNEAIIFEGVKSGYKAFGWGVDNWLSSETAALNKQQVIVLLKLGIKNVVIAWDNDVSWDKILKETKSLRKFINVYAIRDDYGLLGRKEEKLSPVDKGREIWEKLYEERKRIRG